MNKEEWRDIPGYEGSYQASSRGRIRSLGRYVMNGKNSEMLRKGGIIKHVIYKKGYVRVKLSRNSEVITYLVHRLVLTVFDRPPKEGEDCNHKDGNKQNNFIGNLEWCTRKQNCDHRDNVLGKHKRGERCNWSTLTETQAIKIKDLLKEGKLTQQQIAKMFNVGRNAIWHIKTGKTWKHLK